MSPELKQVPILPTTETVHVGDLITSFVETKPVTTIDNATKILWQQPLQLYSPTTGSDNSSVREFNSRILGATKNLFTIDNPETLMPRKTFHVTSTSVLKDLSEGKPLLPIDAHVVAGITTPQGPFKLFQYNLLKGLNILGHQATTSFLYSGPRHELDQSKKIPTLKEVSDEFFKKFTTTRNGEQVIKNEFCDLQAALEQSVNQNFDPEKLSESSRIFWTEVFLPTLKKYTNVRGVWGHELNRFLKGGFSVSNPEVISQALVSTMCDWEKIMIKTDKVELDLAPKPIVLELNVQPFWETTKKTFGKPIIFLDGGRDPAEIQVLPSISPEMIETIYVPVDYDDPRKMSSQEMHWFRSTHNRHQVKTFKDLTPDSLPQESNAPKTQCDQSGCMDRYGKHFDGTLQGEILGLMERGEIQSLCYPHTDTTLRKTLNL
jgi:hypothetical protein